jgi:hypothetical protein
MLLAQGGKFEHGFLSGFVSSLGGSYMDWKGGDMIGLQKIAISAAIGGTAEALGGGKFANGAVTGAFVNLLNHLAHTNTKGEGEKTTKTETSGSKGDELPSTDDYKNGEQVTVNGQKYQLHNCEWVKLSGEMVDAAAFTGRNNGGVYVYNPDNMVDRALIEADMALNTKNAFGGLAFGITVESIYYWAIKVPAAGLFGVIALLDLYGGIFSQAKANLNHDHQVKLRKTSK